MAKLRLKKKNTAIFICALAFFLIEIINPSKIIAVNSLQKNNYSKESAKKIIELGLKRKVLDNKYNPFIDMNVQDKDFSIDNYDFYNEINYDGKIPVKLVNQLKEKGYLSSDVSNILNTGDEISIKDFLNKDKIANISDFLSFPYAKLSLLDRYIEYKKINGVKYETAVTYVNIGLDEDFFTNYKIIDNYNDEMLVNKYNALSENYIPENLEFFPKEYCSSSCPQDKKNVVEAYIKMYNAIKEEGLKIMVNSGYRSYKEQDELYEKYTKLYGKNYNVAKAGFSEHQTGLAIDLKAGSSNTFKGSKEENWIRENGYKYGFILRYESNKANITGYDEPWHIRYVGEQIAEDMKNKKLTYDEYYVRYLEKRK